MLATRRTLLWHLLAILLYSCGGAISALIVPLVARLRFDAGDWQTFFITAATPTVMVVSIFWGELLSRVTFRRYLAVHWLIAAGPFLIAAMAPSYAWLLVAHLLTAIGIAGWPPLNGELLKRFYPDSARGRVYGLLIVPTMLSQIAAVWGAGAWLQANPDSFRILMPIIAATQGAGLIILAVLCGPQRSHGADAATPFQWGALADSFRRMNQTLRRDNAFLRFEAAFMTYGAGFMICEVLFPILVTEKLGLSYRTVAESAHVVMRITLLSVAFPIGWIVDRIGATRAAALSFALLALYPIGLGLARNGVELAIVNVLFGAAMAGVHHGWTLGPVTLAPNAEDVGHYAAIHATLVGLRGILMQGLGMLIYVLTGSFGWSFAAAAICFGWAAAQMWSLEPAIRARVKARANATPAPIAPLVGEELLDR